MNQQRIDLRSDTLTQPSAAVRKAMHDADVGDDSYREDPSVNGLQERIAGLFGFEDALFVPSGLMGNTAAIAAQTHSGQTVLADSKSHLVTSESNALHRLAGLNLQAIDAALPDVSTVPETRLLALEQSHNRRGGTVLPLAQLQQNYDWAQGRNVRVHLDGARIWNAAAAQHIELVNYRRCADSITVAFSKGLGAPVGSAVLADQALITEVRAWRKLLGGQMRQAGVLAAAAWESLNGWRERICADHETAGLLAAELAPWAAPPETNIVLLELEGQLGAEALCREAAELGVLARAVGPTTVRLVTHQGIDRAAARQASQVLRGIIAASAPKTPGSRIFHRIEPSKTSAHQCFLARRPRRLGRRKLNKTVPTTAMSRATPTNGSASPDKPNELASVRLNDLAISGRFPALTRVPDVVAAAARRPELSQSRSKVAVQPKRRLIGLMPYQAKALPTIIAGSHCPRTAIHAGNETSLPLILPPLRKYKPKTSHELTGIAAIPQPNATAVG